MTGPKSSAPPILQARVSGLASASISPAPPSSTSASMMPSWLTPGSAGRPLQDTPGSVERPSAAMPGSTGRPSAAKPRSERRPSPATPSSSGRPSATTPASTGRPSSGATDVRRGDLQRRRFVLPGDLQRHRVGSAGRPSTAAPCSGRPSATAPAFDEATFDGDAEFDGATFSTASDSLSFDRSRVRVIRGRTHLADGMVPRAGRQRRIHGCPQGRRRPLVRDLHRVEVTAADSRAGRERDRPLVRVQTAARLRSSAASTPP